jgi:DNA-binding beta-propeller fold protein YncE
MRTNKAVLFFAAALGAVVILLPVARADDTAKTQYAVQKTLPIGGDERWDYALFDPSTQHVFVTRVTHTQEIDPATGKVVHDITGQKHSHGTAVAPALNRGFITDGDDNSIVIFDLKTGEVLGNAAAGEDADGIVFDAGTNKVLAGCGDAQKLAVLSADADPKAAKADLVHLGGKPEFIAADGAGKAYVNINSKNEVAVVDLKTLAVTAHWPTGTGTKPTGLAIDPKVHRLFVGCRNQKMIVMSTDDGHVIAELAIGRVNDACQFDAGTGEAFASCGDGTLTVADETSPGKFNVTSVQTKQGARTMALDPATHTIYLPTAEFGPPVDGGKRPAPKPGTFMIVVVSPVK